MDNEINVSNPQTLVMEMDYEGENTKSNNPESEQSVADAESTDNENPVVEEQEPEAPQKPRSKRWEKERRDREEKYHLAQALAEERRRNLELQNYLNKSIDTHTMSAADKAMHKLEQAERLHAQALEGGDSLEAARASTALIQANLELERIANTKKYSDDNYQTPNINPIAIAAEKTLNDWLIDNPEFDEESKYFDNNLVSKIAPAIEKLDTKLRKQGDGHLISSPMYFDIIDTIVSQVKSGRSNNRPYTGAVSTRNYNQPRYSQHNMSKPRLTQQQKSVAAACNMTDQQYINWLNKYERDKVEQQNNTGIYDY